MNLLIVVDMQKDFIDGSLGTAEAQAIVPAVKERIVEAMGDRWQVIFTKDTHSIDYLKTQEGINLPVMHCLRGSDGWQFPAELQDLSVGSSIFEKGSFGSLELAEYVRSLSPDAIEVIGLCTDICVLANVALLKAYCPEVPMTVRASCCAGVTPEAHENALNAMKALQVEIL